MAKNLELINPEEIRSARNLPNELEFQEFARNPIGKYKTSGALHIFL